MRDCARFKGCHHFCHRDAGGCLAIHLEHCIRDETLENHRLATFFKTLDFYFSASGCCKCTEVTHAWGNIAFTCAKCTTHCVCTEDFNVADRQTNADATALIHHRTVACLMRERCNDALHERRHRDLHVTDRCRTCFLAHDCDFGVDFQWIVRANLATEAVFQRRNDATAVGVILWVCRCNQQDVNRKTDLVTTNLHITFFKNVQQANLNALGKVRQFVNRKHATVGARNHAVMQSEFVTEVTTFCDLDGVNFTNEVRDRSVWRSKLFAETFTAMHPRNWCVVAFGFHQVLCMT